MVNSKVEVIPVVDLIFGADIGHSSTEVALENASGEVNYYTQPSVIQYNSNRPEEKIIDSVSTTLDQLIDNLHVQFSSKEHSINSHYLVGNEAIKGNNNVRNMDITVSNKTNNEIPLITSISMFAAIALKKYFETTSELPTKLEAQISMCTAIPASEFTVTKGKQLEDRFKGNHTVTLYVGPHSVEVIVNVVNCRVTEEGKTAMFALGEAAEDILKHYKETYEDPKNEKYYDKHSKLKIDDILVSETYHTDIGDGSTEYTYIEGVNPIKSTGLMVGVGHVAIKAIELFKNRLNNTVGEVTRQYFMQLLRGKKPKTPLAKEVFEIALKAEAVEMLNKMKANYISLTNSSAEYLIVHGGGANVYKDEIYEQYVEFAQDALAKVIWIPEKYATKMNSTGLLELAKTIYNKD